MLLAWTCRETNGVALIDAPTTAPRSRFAIRLGVRSMPGKLVLLRSRAPLLSKKSAPSVFFRFAYGLRGMGSNLTET